MNPDPAAHPGRHRGPSGPPGSMSHRPRREDLVWALFAVPWIVLATSAVVIGVYTVLTRP